ncbi:hypothetical protein BDF19DRAFT_426194 [Syncephalis fuscata]|nr:hypothetical protein BDF19DRAFT_426194 [Syncephalis fuscata]
MSPSSQPSVKQSILHSSTRSEKKFRGQELSLGSIDVSPINSGANSPIDEHVSDGMWADGSQLNDQSTVGEDMLPDDEDMAAEIDSIFDADISVATVLSRQDLVRKGEEAIQQLKELLVSPGWKSESKHRSGVQVWTKRVEGDKMPIYRGDKVIEGFSPAEVMSIARHKKLWDEWYDRGNLVENLDNSTSLTSMVMKVHVPSTKPRDLVLVERLEEHPNILLFASTSVTTELCPPVPGRIRAHLRLYGWCLESCIGNTGHLSTKVTYILHTHIGGNAPHVLQKRVLSRRPLVIHAIEQYLHQHGPFNASFVDGDIDSKKDDDNSQDLLSNRVSMMPSAGHGDILAYVQRKTSHPQVITSTSTTDEKEIAKEELVDKADEPQEVQTADSSLKANSSEKSSSRPNLQVSFVEPDNPHKITRPRENTLESELEAVAVPRLSFDLSGYTNNLPEIVPTEEPTIFVAEASLPEVTATNSNASSIVNQHNNSNNTALAEEDMPRPRSSNTSRPSSQLSRRQSATPILAPAHRHAKAIMAARDLTNQLSPLDVWQLQLEQRGVSIYTHQLPDKPMPAVRGDIVVKGWTIEEVMAVVRSLDCRQHWDERFDGGKIVEWLDARTALAHSAVKGSFPVSGRDFCVANEVRSDPETGTLQAVAVSVEDPSVPAQSKRVRAQLD